MELGRLPARGASQEAWDAEVNAVINEAGWLGQAAMAWARNSKTFQQALAPCFHAADNALERAWDGLRLAPSAGVERQRALAEWAQASRFFCGPWAEGWAVAREKTTQSMPREQWEPRRQRAALAAIWAPYATEQSSVGHRRAAESQAVSLANQIWPDALAPTTVRSRGATGGDGADRFESLLSDPLGAQIAADLFERCQKFDSVEVGEWLVKRGGLDAWMGLRAGQPKGARQAGAKKGGGGGEKRSAGEDAHAGQGGGVFPERDETLQKIQALCGWFSQVVAGAARASSHGHAKTANWKETHGIPQMRALAQGIGQTNWWRSLGASEKERAGRELAGAAMCLGRSAFDERPLPQSFGAASRAVSDALGHGGAVSVQAMENAMAGWMSSLRYAEASSPGWAALARWVQERSEEAATGKWAPLPEETPWACALLRALKELSNAPREAAIEAIDQQARAGFPGAINWTRLETGESRRWQFSDLMLSILTADPQGSKQAIAAREKWAVMAAEAGCPVRDKPARAVASCISAAERLRAAKSFAGLRAQLESVEIRRAMSLEAGRVAALSQDDAAGLGKRVHRL